VAADQAKKSILIAIPHGIAGLRAAGIPAPLRLLRQLRRLSGIDRAAFVVDSAERAAWRELAEENETALIGVDEAACRAEATLFAAGDLVWTADAVESLPECDGEGWLLSDPDGRVLDLGAAPRVDERLIEWMRAIVSREERQPPLQARRAIGEQRVLERLTEANRDAVDAAIVASLGREQDPNIPRLTNRRFSKPISTRLAALDVSPNWVTSGAIAVGVCAAVLIAQGGYSYTLAGAVLLIVSRLLDDCDGEVARLTQRQSRFGQLYDVSADILVHMSVFIALAVQLHHANPGAGFAAVLVLFLLGAAASTLLILFFVDGTDLPKRSPLIRRFETAASGDFAYIFFVVAILGLGEWFLYACAVGSHLFWLALAVLIWKYRDGALDAETIGRST